MADFYATDLARILTRDLPNYMEIDGLWHRRAGVPFQMAPGCFAWAWEPVPEFVPIFRSTS